MDAHCPADSKAAETQLALERLQRRLRNRPVNNRVKTQPPRAPQEIEQQAAIDDAFYARIDAAIDFIHTSSEDALRQQTRRNLKGMT